MVKHISLQLTNTQYKMIREHKVSINEIASWCFVEEFDDFSFNFHIKEAEDGTRYIMMNNQDLICVAMYSSAASRQMKEELNMDLEAILFQKIRKELGFERNY